MSDHGNIGRHARICAAAILLAGGVAGAAADESRGLRGQIASADTIITIEAGEHAPALRTLALAQDRAGKRTPLINGAEQTLPDHIEIDGHEQPVVWRLDRSASRFEATRIDLVYTTDSPRMRLTWQWSARGERGPIEHAISIENLSNETVELPLQPSLRFDWRIPRTLALERFWVEKGADTPSSAGTHLDPLVEGERWWGSSSTYARPLPHRPREMIPYLLVDEPGGRRRGFYLGIEFSGRVRITLERRGDALLGAAGLDPLPGPYRTRLAPGGVFSTPTVFLGACAGGPDGAGNVVRHWVRAVLGNPVTLRDASYPPMVNNSWGSGMAVDEGLAQRMISESAQLGLEMFHLDAGWFRDVGDWQPDPAKFPHGIARVADFAHQHGLKFGLWIDWTQAGTSDRPGALNVYDPTRRDWLIADPPAHWRHSEPFKGITVDLGVPAARAWAASELERIVNGYHLDMLEHDGYLVAQGSSRTGHPAAPPQPGTLKTYEDSGYLWVEGSNSTDVSYHATRAYYDIYATLRARHPGLLLEICNDGGRMVDFGSAAHGDYFSITDTYDPLSNRRAFYDASYVLPPAMLESYVQKWPAQGIEGFRYLLRSGMLGWFSLMMDASQWSPELRAEARAQFSLYKSALRPLIRDADLYHVSERPDGVHWDGIEYYSAALRHGVLYAFRGTIADEGTHRFRLSGLEPARRYRLKFQDRGAVATRELSGLELLERGLEVALPLPLSSELVFFEEIP